MCLPGVEDPDLPAPGNVVPSILRPSGLVLVYGPDHVSRDMVQMDEVDEGSQVHGFAAIVFVFILIVFMNR